MKVAFFSSDNSQQSGAFKCLADMVKLLQENFDIEAEVFLPREGDGTQLLEAYGIRYVMIHSHDWIVKPSQRNTIYYKLRWLAEKVTNVWAIEQICKELKAFSPDIVHVNTSWDYVGATAAQKLGIPVVWHIREFLEEDQNDEFWDRDKSIKLINNSSAIIAISKSIKNKYFSDFGNKIHVIYDGIDNNKYYYDNDIFKSSNIKLLSVGGLYPGKGQATIISALEKLKDEGINNFHYQLVGDGVEKNKLKKMVNEKRITDKVEFCGYSKSPEDFYKKNDVFFMSSISEAFGRVTVEAMMSGLLVFGRRSAATKEILEDNGHYYGILFDTEEELVESLKSVFEAPLKFKNLAKAGQQHAMKKFTALHNAEQVYKLYAKIIKSEN